MLALAGPVVLAEIGWVSMSIVDTIVVGPLGPAAIGAVGIGSILFQAVAIFGMGLLLGLETLVSHAHGAGRLDECHRWLVHGIGLSLLVAPALTVLALVGIAYLPMWGFSGEVLRLTAPYLHVLVWSLLPLLLYAAFRRYLQALAIVKPITSRAGEREHHQRGGRVGSRLRPPGPAPHGDDRLGGGDARWRGFTSRPSSRQRSSTTTAGTTSACLPSGGT